MPEIVITVRNKIATASVRQIVCDNTDYTVRLDLDSDWSAGAKTVLFVLQGVGVLAPGVTTDDTCSMPAIRLSDGVGRQLAVGVQQGAVRTTTAASIWCYPSVESAMLNAIVEDESVSKTWLEWVNENMAQAEINVETAERVLEEAQGAADDAADAASDAESARDDALDAKTAAVAAQVGAEAARNGAESAMTNASLSARSAEASASAASSSETAAASSAEQASLAKNATIGYAETAEASATSAAASAAAAEAWATGGSSGTPSATNNAEYWAGEAEDAAESVSAAAAQIAQNAGDIAAMRKELGLVPIVMTVTGRYYDTGGDTIDTAVTKKSDNFDCAAIEIQTAGEVFTVHGGGLSTSSLPWAMIDSAGNVTRKAQAVVVDEVITAEANEAYLILNNRKADYPDFISYYGAAAQTDIRKAKRDIVRLEKAVDEHEIGLTLTAGYYVNGSGGKTAGGSYSYSAPVPVSKGERVSFTASGWATSVAMISECDSSGGSIAPKVMSINADVREYVYVMPNDGYLIFSLRHQYGYELYRYGVKAPENLYAAATALSGTVGEIAEDLGTAETNVTALQNGLADTNAKANFATGNAAAGEYTQVNGLYIYGGGMKFNTNSDTSILVYPISGNTTYKVWKNTVSTMRVATGTIASPVANDTFNRETEHASASSDPLTITSAAGDTYMYIQLYKLADAADMRNNAVHLRTLMILEDEAAEVDARLDADEDRLDAAESAIDDERGVVNLDYWQEELADTDAKIVAHRLAIGARIAEFVFITDPHWAGGNAKNSVRLINRYVRKFGIRDVIVGGDIIRTHTETQASGIAELQAFYEGFDPAARVLSTIGNHDLNSNNNSGHPEAYLTASQLYPFMMKSEEAYARTGGSADVTIYDNESQKVRFIQLNHPDVGSVDSVKTAVTAAIEEKDPTWTVFLFCHLYWRLKDGELVPDGTDANENPNHIYAYAKELDALNEGGQYAHIAALIVGHVHVDMYDGVDGHLLVTASMTDNYWYGPKDGGGTRLMVPGTSTEQSFEIWQCDLSNRKIYITKVGYGDDRAFDGVTPISE